MALSYYRHIRTRAKGRWYGRRIADIAVEFGPYVRLISDPEQIVSPQVTVEYSIHVHEPPVPELALPGSVLAENEQFVAFNKPSGIPVHPTVNYFQHSMTEKLRPLYGSVNPCYRLDRLTSGVIVFGKTAEFVSNFHKLRRSKLYYARVRSNDVPNQLRLVKSVVITDPVVTFNGKLGYSAFKKNHEAARPAESKVRFVHDDGELTTLEVEPITGRTHQIRKHLALHGMPIHNDALYNDDGRFRRLCSEPTEANFEAVWQFTESARRAKLTGKVCPECQAPIYDSAISRIDLHCGVYEFEGVRIEAPAPFTSL